MDRESLTLIINGFDKRKFNQTASIVLHDILKIDAINEDSLATKKDLQKTIPTSILYHLFIDKHSVLDSALLRKKYAYTKYSGCFFSIRKARIKRTEQNE